MNFELDVESKIALAQAGFKPVCSLGSGLMGQRWLFNNTLLGPVCGELASPHDGRARKLIDNIDATSTLTHDSIAKVVRSGELAAGVTGTILEISADEPRLMASMHLIDHHQLDRLFSQLTKAVCFLHKSGLIHGALSPHVVLLRGDKFMLTDLWWVQDTRNRPLNREVTGELWSEVPGFAVPFAAPEVILGHSPTRESDIYSLGAIFYWVLSGMLPRSAGNQLRPRGIDTSMTVRPLTQFREDLDERLLSLIHLMLHDQPEERPIAPWAVGMIDEIFGCAVV